MTRVEQAHNDSVAPTAGTVWNLSVDVKVLAMSLLADLIATTERGVHRTPDSSAPADTATRVQQIFNMGTCEVCDWRQRTEGVGCSHTSPDSDGDTPDDALDGQLMAADVESAHLSILWEAFGALADAQMRAPQTGPLEVFPARSHQLAKLAVLRSIRDATDRAIVDQVFECRTVRCEWVDVADAWRKSSNTNAFKQFRDAVSGKDRRKWADIQARIQRRQIELEDVSDQTIVVAWKSVEEHGQ